MRLGWLLTSVPRRRAIMSLEDGARTGAGSRTIVPPAPKAGAGRVRAGAIGDGAGAAVQMADGNRQRVGRVVRLRRLIEAEQQLHHLLDLNLLRTPVPDDGALD